MEQSYWPLDIAEVVDDKDLLAQCHRTTVDEEFLRDILQQPALSSESESQSFVVGGATATATAGSSLSSSEMAGSDRSGKRLRPSSTPRTYILSFDNSTIISATPEQPFLDSCYKRMGTRSSKSNSSPLSSKKRTLENPNLEPKQNATTQGGKKTRSASQTQDHIMAERKRRQELAEKFIALSATIPGLKKTDKASILSEAISYVKSLKQRVTELEERNKRGKESKIIVKKTDSCANEDTTSSETNSEDCCELLPHVDARVLENEVLIEINCEKENGIELKILDLLQNLRMYVTGSSVLPFGNSILGITIIAQMGDAYRMSLNDLVKTLRQVLLNE